MPDYNLPIGMPDYNLLAQVACVSRGGSRGGGVGGVTTPPLMAPFFDLDFNANTNHP